MSRQTRILLALVMVMAMSFTAFAGYKAGEQLPLGLVSAWAGIQGSAKGNFVKGPDVGSWSSIQGQFPYDKSAVTVRLVHDENKLVCVQTEFGVSMNDFMTYDWYAYGEFHGKLFASVTGLDAVKFTDVLNVCMDEIYAKIMGQYKGEIYYKMANGILTGVRLKRGTGGVLNIYYYLNEPKLNDDGTARTDMMFFEMK